jgi:hypothetical protein
MATEQDNDTDKSDKFGKADEMPTPEEERLAEQNTLDPDVIAHEKEMAERGVNQKGEGKI